MAITKWDAAWADRGTVLTTELNALASAATSSAGSEYANQTNLDRFGKLEVNVTFASAPTAGGTLILYQLTAPDGTNYEDRGSHRVVAVLPVAATTSAQRLTTHIFDLEPAKTKYALFNNTSQAFPASGSTVKLYTQNDETA